MTHLSANLQTRIHHLASRGWAPINSLRVVGRGILFPVDGQRIFSRIGQFTMEMCNGGVVVPPDFGRSETLYADRNVDDIRNGIDSTAPNISSVIQFDGDIVIRLDPDFKKLKPENRKAALDRHFKDVSRALNPMQELQSLISSLTMLYRTGAGIYLGYFEIMPLWRSISGREELSAPIWQDIDIWTHLTSAVALIVAFTAPRILRWVVCRVTQMKLKLQTRQDWIADRIGFVE